MSETFVIGENARATEEEAQDGFVANDITLLGRGDGINQLEGRVWAAAAEPAFLQEEINDTVTSGQVNVKDADKLGSIGETIWAKVGFEYIKFNIVDSSTVEIVDRGGFTDFEGNNEEFILHIKGTSVWRYADGDGTNELTPESQNTAQAGSSIEDKGVKQLRETDKTIQNLRTLEQVADKELRNRYREVKSVRVQPSDPRTGNDVELGDEVKIVDDLGSDLDGIFRVVGIDYNRRGGGESTTFVCANRPRRLVERLSEIERDRNTLNAHMQGATNFNGEHFENNCDETHPLENKVFVPDDVVRINKFQLTFARQSFRGYVQDSGHVHEVNPVINESTGERALQHDHTIDDIPNHTHDIDETTNNAASDADNNNPVDQAPFLSGGGTFTDTLNSEFVDGDGAVIIAYMTVQNGAENTDSIEGRVEIENTDTNDTLHEDPNNGYTTYAPGDQRLYQAVQAGDGDIEDNDIKFTFEMADDSESGTVRFSYGLMILGEHDHDINASSKVQNTPSTTETSQSALGSSSSSKSSGNPVYGIYEPGGEPDVDVEVRVDGNLVTTISDVSVGEEITTPIDLKNDLADPLTGAYHDITLTPVDTGGGENGRSRLVADITQKVFIESRI